MATKSQETGKRVKKSLEYIKVRVEWKIRSVHETPEHNNFTPITALCRDFFPLTLAYDITP